MMLGSLLMLSPVGTGLPGGMRPPSPSPGLSLFSSPHCVRVCLLSEGREGAFPFLLPFWLSIRLLSVVSILAERATER